MKQWIARSRRELDEFGGLVGDAWFDADKLRHDPASRTLTVIFGQRWERWISADDPAFAAAPRAEFVRETWRFVERRVPFMRGTIIVHDVQDIEIDPAIGDGGVLVVLACMRDGHMRLAGVSGRVEVEVTAVHVEAELSSTDVEFHVLERTGKLFGGTSERRIYEPLIRLGSA